MAIQRRSKRRDYFEMFREGARIGQRAAVALRAGVTPEGIDAEALLAIKVIEHEGDTHVHRSLNAIEKAFITPFDSGDMLDLLRALEDVTDAVDVIARSIYMTHVRRTTATIDVFCDILVEATGHLVSMCDLLSDGRQRARQELRELIIEVNRLEDVGDQTFLRAMHELFDGSTEALDVLRLRTLYNDLENAIDRCEDVADTIERILIMVN